MTGLYRLERLTTDNKDRLGETQTETDWRGDIRLSGPEADR